MPTTAHRQRSSLSILPRLLLVASLCPLPLLLACSAPKAPVTADNLEKAGDRTLAILAINDVYRIEGVDQGTRGGFARLRGLRLDLEQEYPDLLLLHAGDLLFPSLLSRQFRGRQMIDVMNLLDGNDESVDPRMFVTFGNHEFDRGKMADAPLLDKRIRQSQFRWLGTDITFAKDASQQPLVAEDNLVRQAMVDSAGIRVGLFSLTTQVDAPEYITAFSDPTETARRMCAKLRAEGAEVVIALTHLAIQQDEALLETLGEAGPDLIVGGHEHSKQSRQVGRRWILKADAEIRTATFIKISLPAQVGGTSPKPRIQFEYRTLGPDSPADPTIRDVVDQWIERHDREYCEEKLGKPPGCLDEALGNSRTQLVGEELEIRRYETNLGNWLVDQARLALADHGAQIAIFNSGSFRLNQNLPAGPITRRNLEEIFQYPARLRLLRITGSQLQEALDHSISEWTGNGHWLQVSGFAYRHDSLNDRADRLTYLSPEGPRPILPEETFTLVLGDYISAGGDGYTLFESLERIPYGDEVDLKDLAIQTLRAAGDAGIAPELQGRICNTGRPGKCLAIQ